MASPQQHDFGVADAVEQQGNILFCDRGNAIRGPIDHFGNGPGGMDFGGGSGGRFVFPSFVAHQGYKPNAELFFPFKILIPGLSNADQILGPAGTGGNHQPPANGELIFKGPGNTRGTGRHDDGVIGRMFKPSLGAVAVAHMNVVITHPAECLLGGFSQLLVPFDRIDLVHDSAQHGRRIARPGSDLKHPVAFFKLQHFGHHRHDIGLRDGLTFSDRKRRILVSELGHFIGQEHFTGHLLHGAQHRRVFNPPALQMAFDHDIAYFFEIFHSHTPLHRGSFESAPTN